MTPSDGGDVEEQRERCRELLEELRTVIPGVQVLFAFLLTVPFSSRFDQLDDIGVQVFAVALLTVALATAVLLTPTAYHRLSPRGDRADRLRLGVRITLAGMALLGISIGSAVFVVGRLIFQTQSAAPAETLSPTGIGVGLSAIVAGSIATLWFTLPLVRRGRDRRHGA